MIRRAPLMVISPFVAAAAMAMSPFQSGRE